MIPFRRDPDFVHRGSIIEDVLQRWTGPSQHHRVAFVGGGGVGGLPGCGNSEVDQLALVFDWLQTGESGSWLMVLDNADDYDMFYVRPDQHPSRPEGSPGFNKVLHDYIPQSCNGRVLVTTRHSSAGNLLSLETPMVEVKAMEIEEATQLLRNKLKALQLDEAEDVDLVKALDKIPLAITQAAAYMKELRIPSSEYLKLYQQNEKDQAALLLKNFPDIRRDSEVQNSVLLTHRISFQLVVQRDGKSQRTEKAGYLLGIVSILDRQEIPYKLLREGTSWNDRALEKALAVLSSFSLITETRGILDDNQSASLVVGGTPIRKSYSQHHLLQMATRMWLQSEGRLILFQETGLKLMRSTFPSGLDHNNWPTCQEYTPHVDAVLSYDVRGREAKLDRAHVLADCSIFYRETGRFYREMGRYVVASRQMKESAELRKAVLGETDPATLASMANLASIYRELGQYSNAETLIQALEMRKEVLGERHPDTLISMANLALTYSYLGQYSNAETLEIQVLEMRKEVLGERHPDTLISMNNLASTLVDLNQIRKAATLMECTVDLSTAVLGASHPRTIARIANLAGIRSKGTAATSGPEVAAGSSPR
ncbi:MAG: hypothetical protein M1814_004803 [Vezdaea aestivalis]|nr:MAG: hypothetical protein M1814_004803 [Vezdaea aestivalis]